MKKIVGLIVFVFALVALPTNAQIKLGVKGGLNISSVHFNSDVIKADNVTGFQVGPMLEANLPIVGLGIETAILYTQKGLETKSVGGDKTTMKTDYIDIPASLKWKLGLPIVKVYFLAGPYIGFRVGGDKIWDLPGSLANQVKAQSFSAGLNFGAGVELIKHLQVGLNYGLGLTENYKIDAVSLSKSAGKNRGWSLTAAILF